MGDNKNGSFLNQNTNPEPPNPVRQLLDPLPIDPRMKWTIWDSYYSVDTPEQFRSKFDTLAIPNNVKHDLWNLKFGDKGMISGQQAVEQGAAVNRTRQSLQRQSAQQQGLSEAIGSVYASLMGGGYAGVAANFGKGLLLRSAMAGLGAAAGEGLNQVQQHITSSESAPQTSGQAAGRMATEGLTQGGLELGAGLAMKPVEWLLRGVSRPKSLLDDEIARISHEHNLRLTAPEITGSRRGLVVQRVASTGLWGQAPAKTAQEMGGQAADDLITSHLNLLSPATAPEATGATVQDIIRRSGKAFSTTVGNDVRTAANALHGEPIDITTLKQWAQQELQQAGTVDRFLARNAGASQFGNLADTPANRELMRVIEEQSLASGSHQTNVLGRPDKTLDGILRDIVNMPDSVPFEVANKLKQDLRDFNPNVDSIFRDKVVGTAKKANALLTEGMETSLGPKGQAWNNARAAYREGRQLFEKSENQPYRGQFIQNILNAKPEAIPGMITSVSDAKALREGMLRYSAMGGKQLTDDATSAWGQVQRQYVQGLLKTPEMLDEAGNVISPSRPDVWGLKARMDKIGDATLNEMFRDNPVILTNLRHIAEAMSRVQKIGGINTLQQTVALNAVAGSVRSSVMKAGLWGGMGATAGYATGHDAQSALIGAGIFEALPWMMSRMLYSKVATELFVRGIGGMAKESSLPLLNQAGRGMVGAAPYAGTALADIYRAFQIAATIDGNGSQGSPQGQPAQKR